MTQFFFLPEKTSSQARTTVSGKRMHPNTALTVNDLIAKSDSNIGSTSGNNQQSVQLNFLRENMVSWKKFSFV